MIGPGNLRLVNISYI